MELDGCIRELLDIMKREVQSFNSISELLILEKKTLIEFNTRELAEILERQEDVFSSIACLEKSRITLLVKIGNMTGDNPESLSVSRLATMVENPLRKKIIEVGHILDTIHDDIRNKKASNSMLIKQGIMMVESDIRVILGAIGYPAAPNVGYGSNAQQNGLSGSVCIDGRM